MLVLSLVILPDFYTVLFDFPVVKWHFVYWAGCWNHSVVVAFKSEVKITFLFMGDHTVIVLEPARAIINIIPVVIVVFFVSIVSNLVLVEAPSELCFINKEDSVRMGSVRIDVVWNLLDVRFSPHWSVPSSSLTSTAVIRSCEVIIVIDSALVWVCIVPLATVAVLILNRCVTGTEVSTPFTLEVLVSVRISHDVELVSNCSILSLSKTLWKAWYICSGSSRTKRSSTRATHCVSIEARLVKVTT